MKKVFSLLFVVLLVCVTLAVDAKVVVGEPDSYNYNRGVEAFYKHDLDEALKYLNKEVKDNPNNGYAYSWIASIEYSKEEYGRALTAADKAVKLIPKKDREFRVFALGTRGNIYQKLGQKELAIQDYGQMIKEFPDELNAYDDRGCLYGELGQYDLAEKDFRKMISLDQGNVLGYMGLGTTAIEQERYEDAVDLFDYVVKLNSDYSAGYSYRAESYFRLGKYDEATDDIIKALALDKNNDMAYLFMRETADSAFNKIVPKLKVQAQKETNIPFWPFCLGVIYQANKEHRDYRQAIEYYKRSYSTEPISTTAYSISQCYYHLGCYDDALEYIDMAIEQDSTAVDYFNMKTVILDNAGRSGEALATMDRFISNDPDQWGAYYQRGCVKEFSGDIDGAIEDYSTAIALKPDFAYTYLCRGMMYRLKGDSVLANDDFRKVIQLDTIPGDNNTAQYAYFYLGDMEKAIEFQDSVFAQGERNDEGNYYDAACLYSIMGETEKSLGYLRKSLELGFRRFNHIRRDSHLENIRKTAEFETLMEEYETKHRESLEKQNAENSTFEEVTAEIPYTKDGGVFSVKCAINDLPLNFIFDTGASDVTMSAVEANFMMKNGYLTPRDIEGRQYYQIANGDISEGTVVNIRDVEFGGLHLSNVRASVVMSQRAPLLLGQSALQKLGKIEIDNDRKVLKITYRKPSATRE